MRKGQFETLFILILVSLAVVSLPFMDSEIKNLEINAYSEETVKYTINDSWDNGTYVSNTNSSGGSLILNETSTSSTDTGEWLSPEFNGGEGNHLDIKNIGYNASIPDRTAANITVETSLDSFATIEETHTYDVKDGEHIIYPNEINETYSGMRVRLNLEAEKSTSPEIKNICLKGDNYIETEATKALPNMLSLILVALIFAWLAKMVTDI